MDREEKGIGNKMPTAFPAPRGGRSHMNSFQAWVGVRCRRARSVWEDGLAKRQPIEVALPGGVRAETFTDYEQA